VNSTDVDEHIIATKHDIALKPLYTNQEIGLSAFGRARADVSIQVDAGCGSVTTVTNTIAIG
jgi:hypothetical protein